MVLSRSAEAFYYKKGSEIIFNHQQGSVSFWFCFVFFTMSKDMFSFLP